MSKSSKKQKTAASSGKFFADIKDIKYGGPDSTDPLEFKYYNAEEVIHGKKMKDWCRFAVAYWHTWRGVGADIFGLSGTTHDRPWDGSDLESCFKRVEANFEFCQKLGLEYYCFHDRDVSPEGATIAETEAMFDQVVEKLAAKQEETGVKLLWGTCNLFSHKRYMNGSATNPDPELYCMAAAQVKKCMEVTHKLGGENFVMWGGRDGYQCLLNTNYGQELKNYAAFCKMVADFKKKIGFEGQLLLEPKPREPSAHQYNFDAETTLGFLDHYGLIDEFALNLEANHGTLAGHTGEHEVQAATSRGKLGSIDANRNECMLGWDTDMFPTDPALSTYIFKCIIEQGGLQPGGLNFDAKVRRESTDVEDIFIGHVNGMDNYARGLRAAVAMIEDGKLDAMKKSRYAGFDKTPIGKKISSGKATLEECAAHAAKTAEPAMSSGKQEAYESIFNRFAYKG